ncbi:MAG: hypothetical protein P4L50_13275 [Anaerolineaceae bacterium]|nr:hypothetical protein [Anaerolineaceae bacterium]
MRLSFQHRSAIFIFLMITMAACQSTPPVQVKSQPTPTNSQIRSTPEIAPSPVVTPLPTAVPTFVSTQAQDFINATVWEHDPQVPILLYHRFLPDSYTTSYPTKTVLRDFRSELESLYDNGYSLVSLQDWINGNLQVPAGRRPIIITLDDAFFADQIYLESDGQPSSNSGVGVLWEFSQQHPDFGFAASIFANMGDKVYGNIKKGNWYENGPGWEDSLAKVIVWCIQHNVLPYNHMYTHPRLDLTLTQQIPWELEKNDQSMRTFLKRANALDLVNGLANMVALPYGTWPPSKGGKEAILNYKNPEGKPLQAVLEAGYYYNAQYLQPPYSVAYNPWHIPRIAGHIPAINFLVKQKDQFPTASTCKIGPLQSAQIGDNLYLMDQILKAIRQNGCPEGVYSFSGKLFRASNSQIVILRPNQ